MARLLDVVVDNPILLRELRRRMRGKAMIFFLIAYVGLVCGVSFFMLMIKSASLNPNAVNFVTEISNVGRSVFFTIVLVQALLVLLVAPSITAGMITAERERHTFDFLRVTTISPFTFAVGGLASTMMYVLLIQICAFPVLCVPFLYGGMAPSEVVGWFGLLLSGSLIMCSIGLFLSSTRERSRTAQGAMMTITLFLFFALFVSDQVISSRNMPSLLSNLWKEYSFFGSVGSAPGWGLFLLFGFLFALLMLVMACRKLYDVENRSLNYTQYLLLFLGLTGIAAGLMWEAVSAVTLTIWFVLGWTWLLFGAVMFGSSAMRVGDDLWEMKRRMPWMRGVDEPLYFMLAACAFWVFATALFYQSGPSPISQGAVRMAVAQAVVSALFLATVFRVLVLARPSHRVLIRRVTVASALFVWGGVPIMFAILDQVTGADWMKAACVSPFYSVLHLLNHLPVGGGGWLSYPGALCVCFYGALTVGLLVLHLVQSVGLVRSQRRCWNPAAMG